MPNTFATAVAALSNQPNHWWPCDDASGSLTDQGTSGTCDLDNFVVSGGQDVAYEAPSICVRSTPRRYGFWGNDNMAATAATLSVVGNTWTTGGLACWVLPQCVGASGQVVFPMSITFNNDINRFALVRILANGAVEYRHSTNPSTNFYSVVTASGVAQGGVPIFICVMQRADGNGIRLYINGADVTASSTTTRAGGTVDSWIDQLGQSVGGNFCLNGLRSSNATSVSNPEYIVVSEPMWWVNATITDAEITNLYNASNPTVPGQDLFEYVLLDIHNDENTRADEVVYLCPMTTPNDTSGGGRLYSLGTTRPSQTNKMNVTGTTGGAGLRVTDPTKVSAYPSYKFDTSLFTSNPTTFQGVGSTGYIGNETAGTWTFGVVVNSVPSGQFKTICSLGSSHAANNIILGLVGSTLGYQIRVDGYTSSSLVYRKLSGLLGIAGGEFLLITIVQPADGGGIDIYVNGVDIGGTESVLTDQDVWINSWGVGGTLRCTWLSRLGSGSVENFDPNDLTYAMMSNRVFTPEQVAAEHDAYNGIFPAPFSPSPPPNGFSETLTGTGNGSDPNGPGPDWYWRMNETGAPLADSGIARLRASPIDGATIATGGDPTFAVPGPLPLDTTDAGVYFDGAGDYFEVGVNGVTGELVDSSTGTVGGFIARNSVGLQIIYSQANDAGTAFWRLGINASNVAELVVQTSAGNSVTVVGSTVLDRAYHLIVATSDGTNIALYVDGALESITVTEDGTGSDGDWFDAFTADNSALGALADSGFSSEITGRLSEVFIYDGDILTEAQVLTLWQAAVLDGVTGVAADTGVFTFDGVTFEDGYFADVLAQNEREGFLQVVRFQGCEWRGGAEGSATYRPQMVKAVGNAQVQVAGSRARFGATPTFGRGGIVGSQVVTTAAAELYGSILVIDSRFEGYGYVDGDDFLAAVMAEAGFGLTVLGNRFEASNGAAVGWRADAQRVNVARNLIDGVASALGGVYVGNALNPGIGTAWQILGNEILDVSGTAGININGENSGSDFARNVLIARNAVKDPSAVGIRLTQLGDFAVIENEVVDPTEGVRIGECQGIARVLRNKVDGNTATAIILAEAEVQVVELAVVGNFCRGGVGGDGVTVSGVRELVLLSNALRNMDEGVQIGNINAGAHIDRNFVEASGVPFSLLAGSTQNGLDIGDRNVIRTLGSDAVLTPDVDGAITAFAGYHPLTASSADDLDTINDPGRIGKLLVLRLAAGSSNITVRDGQDNIRLAGGSDFTLNAQSDQLWLVRNGDGNWHELSQQGT